MDFALIGEVAEKIIIYALAVVIAIERVRRWRYKHNGRDRRKDNPGEPMLVPGREEVCIKHGETLSEIKNELINIRRRLRRLEP